jgi:hypothetical protein
MEVAGTCPYCGEPVSVEIDEGVEGEQRQTEDCWVCCRPIEVIAAIDEGVARAVLLRSDD